MPKRTLHNKAKSEPSTSVPGGVTGTVVASVFFIAGLATFVVGLVRYNAADRTAASVATALSEPAIVNETSLPAETAASEPQPIPTIPEPDDVAQLGATVRAELRSRLALARQPDRTPDALGRLGVFYEAYGYSSHALDCYALAMDADPQNPRWRYHWAIVARIRGDADAAIEAMRLVTQRETEYGPAHERLGLMLLAKGANAEAEQSYQRVITLHPEATSGYVGLGRAMLASGKLEEAAEQFRVALNKDMRSGQAHYLLGQTYQRLGRTQDARSEFARGARSAADALPDPWRGDLTTALVGPKARLAYARYLAQSGRVDESIEILTGLVAVFPTDVDMANSLAVAYLQNGQPEQALPVLHAAADTGRRSYLTYAHLATTLIKIGDLDAALDFAVEATEISPMTARGYFVKGQVLNLLKRDDEALLALRKAAELDPRQGEVHFRLGLTAARVGRHDEAIESLETAATFSPDSVVPLYNLGMIHARTGRFDLAVETLERALKIDPFNSKVRDAHKRAKKGMRNR